MELVSDSAFSNLHVVNNIMVNNHTLVNTHRDVFANSVHANSVYVNGVNINEEGSRSVQEKEFHTQPVVPGLLNEIVGENASVLGGRYNEAVGADSVVVGGRENQTVGTASVACGAGAVCAHDMTLVFNGDAREPLETTTENQVLLGAANGTFVKLPRSENVPTHAVPEGFACFCWDRDAECVAVKTKQEGTLYKTCLPTRTHEIKVEVSGSRVRLVNPDCS